MRRLNVRLLAWLAVVFVPGAVGVHLLHGFQVNRNAEALVERAREKRAAGATDEAAGLLGRYVGLRPDDAAASAELATTLLMRLEATRPTRRDVSRAFAALEAAVRDNPADGPLRLKLAEFCARVGRHADAREHVARLAMPAGETAPDGVAPIALAVVHARAAIGTGEPSEAVQLLATATGFDLQSRSFGSMPGSSDSDTATALMLLAALFEGPCDDPAAADLMMQRLQQAGPDDPQVWITIADWHLEHDNLEAAEAVIERNLHLPADDDRLHRIRGLLAIRRGRPEEAMATLRAGLTLHPESRPLQAMLAELLLAQGDLSGARAAIEPLRAAEGAEAPLVEFLQGWLFTEEGQWLQAKQVLLRLRPQIASADQLRQRVDLLLARCHAALGAYDEQLFMCQSLLAETPTLTAARIGAVSALAALGRPSEALELFEDASGTLPSEATSLRAECLLAAGQASAAVDLLTPAVEDAPDDPRLRASLIEAVLRQQGPEAARDLLAMAPAAVATTPPLLLIRGLLAVSLPQEDADRELTAIESMTGSLPADDCRIVLAGLARLQTARGDVDSAARLWAAVHERHPDDTAAWWEFYDLSVGTGDIEAARRAVDAIERIMGQSSAEGRTARAGHLLLRVAIAMPHRDDMLIDEARQLLLEAEAERPRWQRIHFLMAEADRLRGDIDAERQRLQQAIALGSPQTSVARRLIALTVAARQFDEAARLADGRVEDAVLVAGLLARRPEPAAWRIAVTVLERLASRGLTPIPQRVQLADLRDRLGRWQECRDDLQSLAAAPDTPPAITALLVGKLIDHRELAAARSWFAKLTRTSPSTDELLTLEARLAAASGDQPGALAAAEKLVPVRPLSTATAEVGRRTARLMEELQCNELAGHLLTEVAAASPAAIVEQAEFLARHGEIDKAIERLSHAPPEIPRERVLQAAVTAMRAADPAESPRVFATVARWLDEAGHHHPNAPAFVLLRAEFEGARGNVAAAEALYRSVLEDERADEAVQAVAANNLAFKLAMPETADEAATLIDTAITILGLHPDLLDTRGLVRLAQGDATAAITDLEDACLVPSPSKLLHLAGAYLAAGRTEQAAATIERFRRPMAAPALDTRDRKLLLHIEQALSEKTSSSPLQHP